VTLLGIELGGNDEPSMVVGAVAYTRVPSQPGLHWREDLQFWSAIHALAYSGKARHPLGVETGDKPDRRITLGAKSWGTELTQLTINNSRRTELAQLNAFARRLSERLDRQPGVYQHLVGRTVMLEAATGARLPKDNEALLVALTEVLKQDRGHLGDDAGATGSPIGRTGIYDPVGPFGVNVLFQPGSDQIGMVAQRTFQITRSEAIASFVDRIQKKDEPGNDIVIITCGVPDEYGLVCAADYAIFKLLTDAISARVSVLPKKPNHIRGILVHFLNELRIAAIRCEDSDNFPWIIRSTASQ
jgi:hypothetical protein